MTVALQASEISMYVKVRVTAGAKKESVAQKAADSFRVSVRAPAERGLANQRVIELMREIYPDAKQFKIVSGHTSPSKIISVE